MCFDREKKAPALSESPYISIYLNISGLTRGKTFLAESKMVFLKDKNNAEHYNTKPTPMIWT